MTGNDADQVIRYEPRHADVHQRVAAPRLPARTMRTTAIAATFVVLGGLASSGSFASANLPPAAPALGADPATGPAAPHPYADALYAPTPVASAQVLTPKQQVVAASGLAANGIPAVALNAYRVAAARMASADPQCGISWSLLAGIGRVESDHGQFAGATLNADGTSTPRIIGPALNGHGYPYLPSTDGGALDGDKVYAHAVGPMQFLPSTWAEYASDADGNGIPDPFNINDAALAAARYLCAAGGNLRTSAGQAAAVFAYNHSDQYVAEVLALANDYAHGIRVNGIPVVGKTTGGLPALGAAPTAPVNPAPPTSLGTQSGTTAAHTATGKGALPASGHSTSKVPSTGTTSAPPTPGTPSPTPTPTPTATSNPVQKLVCQLVAILNLCPKSTS